MVGPRRQPISDVSAYLEGLPDDARAGLRALGELLVGVTQRPPRAETADRFTARCLGASDAGQLIDEDRDLDPVSRLTTAVALAEWITIYADVIEVGSGEYSLPPKWIQTEIGGHTYRHPQCLLVHFPAGTLMPDAGCVIGIEARQNMMRSPEVSVSVAPDRQDGAREILDRLAARANELNPYRGRALRATYTSGLHLRVIDLPTALCRDTVIVDEQVWREIDLGLTAVRDRHELLNSHGLGARRGVLLCGPSGTGKSAVSAVIAAEARILTLASTNDDATLDKAAIRTGRFDAIVDVGYPTRTDAARILTALITNLPGTHTGDTHAIVAALPDRTSGSDLREIVRRAILSADHDGHLSTAALLAEVGSGRYRATAPEGLYL